MENSVEKPCRPQVLQTLRHRSKTANVVASVALKFRYGRGYACIQVARRIGLSQKCQNNAETEKQLMHHSKDLWNIAITG